MCFEFKMELICTSEFFCFFHACVVLIDEWTTNKTNSWYSTNKYANIYQNC